MVCDKVVCERLKEGGGGGGGGGGDAEEATRRRRRGGGDAEDTGVADLKTRTPHNFVRKKQNLLFINTRENSGKAWDLISGICALPWGNPDGVSIANSFVLRSH